MDFGLKISRIICITLLFSVGFSQQVIAVHDIVGPKLTKTQKKQIFNKLESELVNLETYEVISRSNVDKILKEQKFQNSGCTDQECAAEIGKLLNADFMLLSEILYEASESGVDVSLKLVDVETAKIINAINEYTPVKTFREVINTIPGHLISLAGFGWLTLNGMPSKSNLFLDDRPYKSPLLDHKIDKGSYSVIIKKDGYVSQTHSFTIRPQEHYEFDFTLLPIDRKTALRKALMFPGSGHYYAENQKKGNFFRYLTLASLVFTTKAYLDYSNTLKAEDAAYLEYKNAVSQDDIESTAQIYRDESAKLSQNLALFGVGGGATAAIWIYNVIHLNSFLSPDNLSYENSNLNIGITPNGRLQAQITF